MSSLANDLDKVLGQVDRQTAVLLEQTVRDALALAQRTGTVADASDTMGYPLGYFESTAGSFANEPLDAPHDFEPQPRESW
ncbi:MAG TPA: hypothetical protein VGI40_13550 [Pirellulaceae bacterium]|jgi:hypothetical protein